MAYINANTVPNTSTILFLFPVQDGNSFLVGYLGIDDNDNWCDYYWCLQKKPGKTSFLSRLS